MRSTVILSSALALLGLLAPLAHAQQGENCDHDGDWYATTKKRSRRVELISDTSLLLLQVVLRAQRKDSVPMPGQSIDMAARPRL